MALADNLRYTEYLFLGSTDRFKVYNRIVLFITFAALVLLVVSFILLAILAARLKRTLDYGNLSQKECGNNYIENETARYQLFVGYKEKTVKLIKILLQTALLLIVLALLVVYGGYAFNKDIGNKLVRTLSIAMGVLLVAFYITFQVVNKDYNFISKYNANPDKDAAKEKKRDRKMIGLMSTVLVLIVLACLLNIIYLDDAAGNTSVPTGMVLFVAVFVMIFMFIVQRRAKQINDRFITVYSRYKDAINDGISSLRSDTRNIVKTGVLSGKTVKDWMNIMLARNIKKTRPNEDVSNPLDMKSNDAYANDAYSYMEHRQGNELAELPNVGTVNAHRTKIRVNMRNMRRENDAMIAPARKLAREINLFLYTIILIIVFMLYHISYVRQPLMTKVVLVGVILAMVLWVTMFMVI